MFADIGKASEAVLDAMSKNFEPWVAGMIEEGKYIGWITEDDGRPIASNGMLILDWPPHPLDAEGAHRGYMLNMFVEREYRRRGIAQARTGRSQSGKIPAVPESNVVPETSVVRRSRPYTVARPADLGRKYCNESADILGLHNVLSVTFTVFGGTMVLKWMEKPCANNRVLPGVRFGAMSFP